MRNYGGEGPITALRNAGIGVLGNVAGNYLTQLLTQKKLESMALLANQIKTAENAGPDEQQAILGKINERFPGMLAKMPAVQGYAPPGLESSVDTPNPLDQLLSSQSGPTAFQRLSGAVPITKGETMPAVPGNIFATAAPDLKQQVANQVAGTPGGALQASALLAKIGAPGRPNVFESKMAALNNPNTTPEQRKLIANSISGNPSELQYIMGLPPEQQKQVFNIFAAKRPMSQAELLQLASGDPVLAKRIGDAATAMQPQPTSVDLINPDAATQPTKVTKDAKILPSKQAKTPSLVTQEKDLRNTIVNNLGKFSYTMPSEDRIAGRQLNNQFLGQLNDIRKQQNLVPITNSDLINNEFNRAKSQTKDPAVLKRLQDRRDELLKSIGAE